MQQGRNDDTHNTVPTATTTTTAHNERGGADTDACSRTTGIAGVRTTTSTTEHNKDTTTPTITFTTTTTRTNFRISQQSENYWCTQFEGKTRMTTLVVRPRPPFF